MARSRSAGPDGADEPGELTLYETTQNVHGLRKALAPLLGYPENKVRVIVPDMGGGFGNRADVAPETRPGLHRRQAPRPAGQVQETRTESNQAAMHGRGQTDIVEAAVKPTTAPCIGIKVTAICDIGAYNQYLSPIMGMLTGVMLPGNYDIPNVRYELQGRLHQQDPGRRLSRGRPPRGDLPARMPDGRRRPRARPRPRRGPPQELHRAGQVPAHHAFGTSYDTGDYEKALDKALEVSRLPSSSARSRSRRAPQGKLMGVGLAAYVEICGFGPWEQATVRVDPSGKIRAYTGVSPHGQGTATSLAQIVADELGVDIDDIIVIHGDTAQVAAGNGTGGSRGVVQGGSAMLIASTQVRDKAVRIAAHLMEASPDDVEHARSADYGVRGAADRTVTLGRDRRRRPTAATSPPATSPAWRRPASSPPPARPSRSASTSPSSTSTRRPAARRSAASSPSTTAAPSSTRCCWTASATAASPRAPPRRSARRSSTTRTASSSPAPSATTPSRPRHILPMFELDRTETLSPRNPLGAKGIGEAGTIGSTPAVRSAVLDALRQAGVTDFDMPALPNRVWRALQAAKK